MQVRAIVTMEGEYETVAKLLSAAISDDLEWPVNYISRSRYYSTLNNSKMVQDITILTMADHSRMWLIDPRILGDLERPLPRFQGHAIICFRFRISPKRLKMRPKLLKRTNRKPYTGFRNSNGTIFNHLEWPLIQISRSRYYWTSNNSNGPR